MSFPRFADADEASAESPDATPEESDDDLTFSRVKVPQNRPRWVPLEGGGYVPLDSVIARNLDLMFPVGPRAVYAFRVTRGAEGEPETGDLTMEEALREPGSIIRLGSGERNSIRFAFGEALYIGIRTAAERFRAE